MSETQIVLATTAKMLEEKIRARTARVGIVGLGYVGLPLAVEFAKAGFTVTGIDVSEEKTRSVNAGDSYIGDIPSATLAGLVESGKLRATTDFSAVLELDTINICVPTPLRKTKDPGHELHRVGLPGDRAAFPCRACWSSWNRPPIRAPPTNWCCRCWPEVGPEGRAGFLPVLLAGARGSRAIRSIQTANIPKVVGGCTPACTEMGAAVLLAGAARRWCR